MNNRSSPQRSGRSSGDSPREGVSSGPLRARLAIPLFWKIVLANGALMALVGWVTIVALSRPGPEPVDAGVLVVLLLGTLMAAAVVNAWIVALALRPLEGLTRTAEAVRLGDLSARAPVSGLADRELDRLARVLNNMLEALSASRERQKALSHRVVMAEERERERIAGELYAGTAQTLAGVLVRLQVVLRQVEGKDRQPLEELASEVRSALEEVRAFARRLRPPELDELGVRPALEAHARGLASSDVAPIDFRGDVPEDRLSEEARLALFRVVQEALTNAAHHSGASVITVSFNSIPEGLEAVVEDDGCGFDPEGMARDPIPRLGLLTMTERAGYAQGIFKVDSAPGSGTRVRLVLPWTGNGPDGASGPATAPVRAAVRSGAEPPGAH